MLTLNLHSEEKRILLDALSFYVIRVGELADAYPTESDKWRELRSDLGQAMDLKRRLEFMP